jgi:hypothetical protein
MTNMSKLPLKYVHRFRDRHGHLRHYFRRDGRRLPLPGLVGSEEFLAAYQAALAGESVPAKPEILDVSAVRTSSGSESSMATSALPFWTAGT